MNINELLLDFRITSRCNKGCDLCFRNLGIEDQPLPTIKKVLTKMYDIGFRRVGITGGEPTIREDYIDIISYAKELGFLTYLSTVGNQFIRHAATLNKMLNWVGLPIDGIDYKTNSEVRSLAMGNQHETIKKIFNYLHHNPSSVKIKLTTVVTQANMGALDSVVSFVINLPAVDFKAWRFYQFCPLGVSKGKRDKLEISTEQFILAMNELKSKYSNYPISWATFEERDKANVVMEPNFDVILPDGEKYRLLCNMEKDSESFIISKITQEKEILEKCANNRKWVY